MPQSYFCDVCGIRVTESELEHGRGWADEHGNAYCEKHLPKDLTLERSSSGNLRVIKHKRRSSGRHRQLGGGRRRNSTHRRDPVGSEEASPGKQGLLGWLLLVVVVVGLLGALYFLTTAPAQAPVTRRSEPAAPERQAPTSAPQHPASDIPAAGPVANPNGTPVTAGTSPSSVTPGLTNGGGEAFGESAASWKLQQTDRALGSGRMARDKAITAYAYVIKIWPGTATAETAQKRIAALKDGDADALMSELQKKWKAVRAAADDDEDEDEDGEEDEYSLALTIPGPRELSDPGPGGAGLRFVYYESLREKDLWRGQRLRPKRWGVCRRLEIPADAEVRGDDWSIDYQGRIEVPADGEYSFYTTSDDGSFILIDGEVVVDNRGSHSAREARGKVRLTAGSHEVRVYYYQLEGDYEFSAHWSGPGIEKQEIPADVLSHVAVE